MKFLIRLILSVFVGGVLGFVILIINEDLCIIVTSGIVAFIVGSVLDGVFEKSSLRWLIMVAGGIVAFIAYLSLLIYLNEEAEALVGPMIAFFAPYVLTVFAISCYASGSNSSDNN